MHLHDALWKSYLNVYMSSLDFIRHKDNAYFQKYTDLRYANLYIFRGAVVFLSMNICFFTKSPYFCR